MRESSVVDGTMRILLGGGIGAGKGVAGRWFARLGVTVVEADRIGHALLEPDGYAYHAVAERWPEVLVDGIIQRGSLAAIVFLDEYALAELEEITHPEIIRRIREIAATADDVVVELPVPIDLGAEWVKVLVTAHRETRRARALARGGTPSDVDARMERQPRRAAWMDWADEVIENDGTIEDLNRNVDALWRRLIATHGGATS
jgi:dephospho-CoA kinase